MVSSNFPNRPFGLRESTWINYQEVGNNRTNWHGELWIDRYNSNYGTYSGAASSFQFFLNGSQVAGWNFTYNFNNYNNLLLAAVDVWVPHNSDGTKTAAIDGYANVDIMGYTEVHSSFGFPTIPRASTSTWATAGNPVAGVAKTLNTNRASSGFTHTIDYTLGAATGNVGTGIGASVSWTPPLSLINQFPNAPTGTGKFKTYTYNGGTLIGTTESSFTLEIDSSVIPTWTSATITDATPGVETTLGAGVFLQNVSKLIGTITGAAGVYGSTISSYQQSVGTETINAATANFTKVLSTAGTAVPVTQEITDSRGRKKTLLTNINVMPYSKPVVTSTAMVRTDGAGTPDPAGTSMKVSVVAAVQSVVNGTERNRMTIQVYTKLRSETTWTLQGTPVNDSATLGYSGSTVLPGPFSVASAYDVRVDVIDKFSTSSSQKVLSTGEIFQHWSTGLGVGKYWEKGMVDIAGDLYSSSGVLSLGKRITNLNDAIYEGRYHFNGPANQPPNGPNGLNYGQGVLDVDTWYEVQGATIFHFIRQRFRWINTDVGNNSRRNRESSFRRGYAMTRTSLTGGATWTAWVTDEPGAATATAVGGAPTYNNIMNAWEFSSANNFIALDGVFKSDVTCYRADYYYRTGDSNGNRFLVRTGGAYDSNVRWNYQNTYVSGTGTPGAAQTTNSTVGGGLAAQPSDLHFGHIIMHNFTQVGKPKTWTFQESGNTTMVVGGGHLSGTGVDNLNFDGFVLQTSGAGNNFTHGWLKITALF